MFWFGVFVFWFGFFVFVLLIIYTFLYLPQFGQEAHTTSILRWQTEVETDFKSPQFPSQFFESGLFPPTPS